MDTFDTINSNAIELRDKYFKGDPQREPRTAFLFTENAEASDAVHKTTGITEAAFSYPYANGPKLNVSDVRGTNQAGIRTDKDGNLSPNAFGIVVKKYQQDENGKFVKQEGCFLDTDIEFAQFKRLNERVFAEIDAFGPERIVLPRQMGLGKAALPRRFAEWLADQINTRFGVEVTLAANENSEYEGFGFTIGTPEQKHEEAVEMRDIPTVYTAGIGSKVIKDFIAELKSFGIDTVCDVRNFPDSAVDRNFRKAMLKTQLAEAGISYRHYGTTMGEKPSDYKYYQKDPVTGRHDKRMGVDYEAVSTSPDFIASRDELIAAAENGAKIAFLGSESAPERSHRSTMVGHAIEKAGLAKVVNITGINTSRTNQEVIENIIRNDAAIQREMKDSGSTYLDLKFYSTGEVAVGNAPAVNIGASRTERERTSAAPWNNGIEPVIVPARSASFINAAKEAAAATDAVVAIRVGDGNMSFMDDKETVILNEEKPGGVVTVFIPSDGMTINTPAVIRQTADSIYNALAPKFRPMLPDSFVTINLSETSGWEAALDSFAAQPVNGFLTTEGSIQAQKLFFNKEYTDADYKLTPEGIDIYNRLQAADGPTARMIGDTIKIDNEEDWNKRYPGFLKDILVERFRHNPEAMQSLLATGDAVLEDDNKIYADTLTQIRSEHRDELRQTITVSDVLITGTSLDTLEKRDITQGNIDDFLVALRDELSARGLEFGHVHSTGQTGVGEAAVKSEQMRGKAPILCPTSDFKFRFSSGSELGYIDIPDRAAYLNRFKGTPGKRNIKTDTLDNELTPADWGEDIQGLSDVQKAALALATFSNEDIENIDTYIRTNNITTPDAITFHQVLTAVADYASTAAYYISEENILKCMKDAKNLINSSTAQGISHITAQSENYPDILRSLSSVDIRERAKAAPEDNDLSFLKGFDWDTIQDIQESSSEGATAVKIVPPTSLWCKGDASLLRDFGVAFIGSQTPSTIDTLTTSYYVRDAVRSRANIIVPLAEGIPLQAIDTALDAGGKVIVVVPGPIDNKTLDNNKYSALLKRVVDGGGLLVSETAIGNRLIDGQWTGTGFNRYNEQRMAHIVAGISTCTVALSCAALSAEENIADTTLALGKNVYAVDYPAIETSGNEISFEGLYNLLREGAKPVDRYAGDAFRHTLLLEQGYSEEDIIKREAEIRRELERKQYEEYNERMAATGGKLLSARKAALAYADLSVHVLHVPGETIYFVPEVNNYALVDAVREFAGDNARIEPVSKLKEVKDTYRSDVTGDRIQAAEPWTSILKYSGGKLYPLSIAPNSADIASLARRRNDAVFMNDLVNYCNSLNEELNKLANMEGYAPLQFSEGFTLRVTPEEIKITEGDVVRARIYMTSSGTIAIDRKPTNISGYYKPILYTAFRGANMATVRNLKREIRDIMFDRIEAEMEGGILTEREKEANSEENYFGERQIRRSQEEDNTTIIKECVTKGIAAGTLVSINKIPSKEELAAYCYSNDRRDLVKKLASGEKLYNYTTPEVFAKFKEDHKEEIEAAVKAESVAIFLDLLAKNGIEAKEDNFKLELMRKAAFKKAGSKKEPARFDLLNESDMHSIKVAVKEQHFTCSPEEATELLGKAAVAKLRSNAENRVREDVISKLFAEKGTLCLRIGHYGEDIHYPAGYSAHLGLEGFSARPDTAAAQSAADNKKALDLEKDRAGDQMFVQIRHNKNGLVTIQQVIERKKVGMGAKNIYGELQALARPGGKIISGWYDSIYPFDGMTARAVKDGQMVLLNVKGEELISPKSDNSYGKFLNGKVDFIHEYTGDNVAMAAVFENNGKKGLLSRTGRVVAPAVYDIIESPVNGFALVVDGEERYNFINVNTGEKMVKSLDFQYARTFSEGVAVVRFPSDMENKALAGKYNYIAANNCLLFEENFLYAGDFKDGVALVRTQNGMNKFINIKGENICDRAFKSAEEFSEGLALVQFRDTDKENAGKYNFINSKGEIVFDRNFDSASSFKNGKASVQIDGERYEVASTGEFIGESPSEGAQPKL